ncbi:NADPH-dependent FMN reductase [Spirillospora sp. CA-294931]|uniref:NADPH-dependent FMN reductase n=1 Tax=Spirillospora sp. CA-294931 TaxID=3240042 RepID=UPI003D92D2CF
MSSILVLSGSPSPLSRTAALSAHLASRLRDRGHDVGSVAVRELPPAELLAGDASDPRLAEVVRAIAAADGLIVASPVYKAAYSGLLKTLLDLLPQFALAGKVVLPILTGGTPAHVLAVDYALRPVLAALGAGHVVQGRFVLDRHIELVPGGVRLDPAAREPLYPVVDAFSEALTARRPLAPVR